jgi:hypothetical protein
VAPAHRGVVADHPCQVCRRLDLESGRHRRDLARDVVGVVQHRREVPDLRGNRLLEHHVALVPPAEERNIPLQLGEEPHELLGERGHRLLVPFAPLLGFSDSEPILGMVVTAPEDVVPQRLGHQTLKNLGILRTRTEEPRVERVT